jgi:hypothetical protein
MASQDDARSAIYAAVISATKAAENMGPGARAQVLAAAGIAYRAAAGGAQVGGVHIEK